MTTIGTMRASFVLVVALGLVATVGLTLVLVWFLAFRSYSTVLKYFFGLKALAGSRSLLRSRGDNEVTHTDEELEEFLDILQRIEEEEAEGAKVKGSPDSAPYVSVRQHNRLVRWLGKKTKQLNSYNKERIPQLNLKPAEKN